MNKSANPAIAHAVGLMLYALGIAAIVFSFATPAPLVGISAGITCLAFGSIIGLLHDIEKNTRK